MSIIHPTAVIAEGATLGQNVEIGAYCVIGAKAKLGNGCKLKSHVAVDGDTDIGENCTIYPFASLGHAPQDLKFHGEASTLKIGARNTIREHVTINPGTEGGGMETSIGDDCLLMVGAHVAHDCKVGNRVIMANNATLAGHVSVGDGVVIGGLSAVHQFVRIGAYAMIGGMSGVEKDVIPYGLVMGERAHLSGLNLVGLKRRNIDREAIHALRHAYKLLFENEEGVLDERIRVAEQQYPKPEVHDLIAFLKAGSDRSFCMPATTQG